MKEKRSLYNYLNVFETMLLSTLLPCFLATLLLAMVFLPMMNRAAEDNDNARAQVVLDALSNQFEDLHENIGEITDVIEHSSWIHPLYLDMLNGKVPGASTKKVIARDLNMACNRAGAKSASFKFYDSPVLYNNRGVVSDQELYLNLFKDNIQYLFYTSDTQTSSFSTTYFDGVHYLLYQSPFRDIDGGRNKGEINILFQSSYLGEKLSSAIGVDMASCYLEDLDGNKLWEYNTELYNEETVTLSQRSPHYPLNLCIEIPASVHNQSRNTVVPAMIATLAVSLVISVVLSYILTRATYQPIQQIMWKFVGKDVDANNEFLALEYVFDQILQEKTEAEHSLDRLLPIAQQKVLGTLLDGTAILGDSAESQLDHCHIQFNFERFNVISMEVPFSQLQEAEVECAAELALETLLDHLSGQLPLKAHLYYKDSDHYQIIVNYRSWENLQSYISLLTANCRQYFQKYTLAEGVYMGVGQVVFSPNEIYRAAEQADTAINVAVLNRLNQPMFYNEVAPELNYEYFYPMSEEMLLSRAITNCNTETAKELLYGIIEENRRRPQLNPKCLWLLHTDLASTVARSGQSLGITLAPIDTKEVYIGLDEVKNRIETMIEDICNQIISRRQKNITNSEMRILNYIDEHIFDPDLSLNGVAERFGKSTTYISLLFKEQRGIHYNTYVNQTRILRAVQIMGEQNVDSNAVYPMVGYVSLSTFRRNFTKYAKSNPGEHAKDTREIDLEG